MTALYSLRDVSRRFGEREVLRIDSLDIAAGEIYALLGANGAGKSTLMRLLAFLDTPTSGALFFRGEKVLPGREARYRAGVVWAPQHPVMFTGTLRHNIEYPMVLCKTPRPERKKRALELLERVNLAHLADSPAHKLSGGEAQRASIARALAAGATTILFDEPTANVDQRSQEDFLNLARGLWEDSRLSLLITTHDAALAASLCRKQIFLMEGRLVRQHVLPGGGVAWPARLAESPDGLCAYLTPEAAACLPPSAAPSRPALLRGVAAFAAGISLRLEAAPGHMLELLLEDAASRDLARTLTLDAALVLNTHNSGSFGEQAPPAS